MRLKLSDIPEEIIVQYKLRDIATPEGYVYSEITKGMYGLPQAGIIAQVLLEDRLGKHGYSQSNIIPGLWTHKTRPILFSLVVDDFAVKYTRKEDAEHLLNALKRDYIATEDWEGTKTRRTTYQESNPRRRTKSNFRTISQTTSTISKGGDNRASK